MAVEPRVIQSQETVAGQMEGLLSKESPLVTMSRTKAKEDANKRGMLNTTMAVQAGEAAAYQSALPIAQQDAQTAATSGQSSQEAKQEIDLTTHKGEVSGGLIEKEYGLKGELSTQEATQQSTLSEQEAGQTSALSKQEADQKGTLLETQATQDIRVAGQQKDYDMAVDTNKSEWDMAIREMMETNSFNIATMEDVGTTARTNIEAANRVLLADIEASTGEKQATIDLANDLGQQFQDTLKGIAVSDLSSASKTAALNNALNSYVSMMTTGAKIAGLDISWHRPNME